MTDSPRYVCFDTNVILDVLQERMPFAESAARLIDAVSQRRIQGLLGATTLTTVDFLLRRRSNRLVARKGLVWLLSLFEVAPVNRTVIDHALRLEWPDFEDAVLHEAARLSYASALITRNISDFKAATLPIYTPEEFLAILDVESA